MKKLITLLFIFGVASESNSQTILYDNIVLQGGISPPPTVNTFHTIDLNLAGLALAPETIQLDFPDDTTAIVNKSDFVMRDEGVSYKWSGGNDNYDVLFTVHNNQLMGYITSDTKRYGIEMLNDGINYRLVDFFLAGFPQEGEIINKMVVTSSKNTPFSDTAYMSHIKSFEVKNNNFNKQANGTTIVVDMLIVWMEEARIEAGGAIGDPNDTQGIELLMFTAVDHANLALSNSLSNTRVTKFHTAKLNGFSLSGDFFVDLEQFRNLTSLKQLRDQVNADIVTGIIESDFALFQACGVAHVQTFPGCGVGDNNCVVGSGFDNYAYNLVTQFCTIWDDTFTHEMGHLMGANHARDEMTVANRDAIINNGFPEAFARRSGSFKSILSITQATTSRRLYFSNPNVTVSGNVTGINGQAFNLNVIDSLTPAMSNFRTSDIIFANGFE